MPAANRHRCDVNPSDEVLTVADLSHDVLVILPIPVVAAALRNFLPAPRRAYLDEYLGAVLVNGRAIGVVLLDTIALADAHHLKPTTLVAAIATNNHHDLSASDLLVDDPTFELRNR
ncbi:hypothetical protein OG203_06930 [Nocardia sp. NBC_01499]|uniref:hypothetical protein n=1 Tax=Nocardia sp. NBC_01499 TaxID=2903597 RepID=UPI00386E88DF